MIDSRLKKVWGDLAERKGRTILTLAGLVIGIWGIGSVFVAALVLSNDLGENYARTNAPSVAVNVAARSGYKTPDADALPPGVEVENRPLLYSRIEVGPNNWMPLLVFVVEDFDNPRIAKMFPEEGAWPPPKGTIAIERDAEVLLTIIRKQQTGQIRGHNAPPRDETLPTGIAEEVIGSTVRIRLPEGQDITAEITGTVFDPGQAPSKMEQLVYGYVTRQTANAWLPEGYSDRLLATVEGWKENPDRVQAAAAQLSALVEAAGGAVTSVGFPSPDQHPHQFQMNSILFLLGALGGLGLVMSLVLVVNLVGSILTNQIRQIGVLKAIGAGTRQVSALYFSSMAILGVASAVIALPFMEKAGYVVVRVISGMLNFDVLTVHLPVWAYAVIIFFGGLLPVMAAWFPVRKWSGVAVRDALDNYGAAESAASGSAIDKAPLPVPLVVRLGIRNALRKPKRFILTVATLAGGILIFILAMNIRASLLATADKEEATKLYDVSTLFSETVPFERISWVTRFPIVDRIELWDVARISVPSGSGAPGPQFTAWGVPGDTKAVVPNIIEGRWLDPARPDGIVINHRFANAFPEMQVRQSYTFEVAGERKRFEILGIFKEFGGAAVYLPEDTLRDLTGNPPGSGRFLMTSLKDPDNGEDRATLKVLLEEHFEMLGLNVVRLETTKVASQIIRNHLGVIVVMLAFVAFLMLVVSGLGMASAIATGVVERTRELGALRAIGAAPGTILRVLLSEALFMAIAAFAVAALAAPPLTAAFGSYFGSAFVEYPFDYATSGAGLWASLVAAVVLACLATAGPARVATRGAVAAAIAYE